MMVFVNLAGSLGQDVTEALVGDDVCAAGQDCRLELTQLRGMKSPSGSSLEASSWPHASCCSGCGTAFCSPNSGTCYDYKDKYYYLECRSQDNTNANSNCCRFCGGSAFCSPGSGNCYSFKGKDYYLECAGSRLLQGKPGLNSTITKSSLIAASRWRHYGCCAGCRTAFCFTQQWHLLRL